MAHPSPQLRFILDVGGEGRHPSAWNLNPSPVRTIGSRRGAPIPRHIRGRADDIPLPNGSVNELIVERTPLLVTSLREIARVIAPGGTIVLRHAPTPIGDPHALARRMLPGHTKFCMIRLDNQIVQETHFYLRRLASVSAEVRHKELLANCSSTDNGDYSTAIETA